MIKYNNKEMNQNKLKLKNKRLMISQNKSNLTMMKIISLNKANHYFQIKIIVPNKSKIKMILTVNHINSLNNMSIKTIFKMKIQNAKNVMELKSNPMENNAKNVLIQFYMEIKNAIKRN